MLPSAIHVICHMKPYPCTHALNWLTVLHFEECTCDNITFIWQFRCWNHYRQTSNISHTLGNKIVDHSDVVGASHVGAAPTTSSFSTSADKAKATIRRDKKHLAFGICCVLCQRFDGNLKITHLELSLVFNCTDGFLAWDNEMEPHWWQRHKKDNYDFLHP